MVQPYAYAVFELASSPEQMSRFQHDLQSLCSVLADMPQLHDYLQRPDVAHEQHHALLDEVLNDRVDPVIQRLVHQLLLHHRLNQLPDVLAHFNTLVHAHQQVLPVTVTTVSPVTPGQTEQLIATLKQITGYATIQLQCETDSRLLGGVILRMFDFVVDGSLRGRLAQLQTQWS